MNGPLAAHLHNDDSKVSDYCIGKDIIYVGFAWSEAANAHRDVFSCAKKHGVGFFDVSANNGGVWLPDREGAYVRVFNVTTKR